MTDVSEIHAGRDIIYETATIGGQGTLDVQAGHNIYEGFQGPLRQCRRGVWCGRGQHDRRRQRLGDRGRRRKRAGLERFRQPLSRPPPMPPTLRKPLASQSGKAVQTADTVGTLADLYAWDKSQGFTGGQTDALAYFNGLPAAQRAKYPTNPLLFQWLKDQGYAGTQGDALAYFLGLGAEQKSQFTYNAMLFAWLQTQFGYSGNQAGALSFFNALPTGQQAVFLRQVYFDELTAGGREFNDPSSSRYQSYLRGRDAVAALFPTVDASGQPITYNGTVTMFSGVSNGQVVDSGIHTEHGGDIQLLVPGGQTILGVEGITPPAPMPDC